MSGRALKAFVLVLLFGPTLAQVPDCDPSWVPTFGGAQDAASGREIQAAQRGTTGMRRVVATPCKAA